MRISFENDININRLQTVSQSKTGSIDTSKTAETASGFMVSLGQNTGIADAYSEKKSQSALQENMTATDVDQKRDYMAVMSLSMSDEDYTELAATGEVPEDTDVTDTVTILDDIKTALIKGGTQVEGYTDDISAEVLEKITGSVSAAEALVSSMHEQDVPVNDRNLTDAAEALTMAQSVLPLSDQAVKYLMDNDLAPTIQNVYQASHSSQTYSLSQGGFYSQNGYLTRAAETADMESLMPQIEKTIERSGLENNEEIRSEAEWLIDNGIPFTSETLNRLDTMKYLREEADTEAIADSVAIAMSAGIKPAEANLTYDESIYTKAADLADEMKNIPDEAADLTVENEFDLTLQNLRKVMTDPEIQSQHRSFDVTAQEESPDTAVSLNVEDLSAENIHARRVLEETRLTMTVEANRALLKSNFQIDTAPMEQLIDALKEAEKKAGEQLFPGTEEESAAKADIYRQAKSELAVIPSVPAAILGQTDEDGTLAFGTDKTFTIHDVYEAGNTRMKAYEQAGEAYETLMTSPRADLGDSIQKAFNNVDDILNDLNLETSDENRRAVRILGYNSMEVTAENVQSVEQADSELRSTLGRLTPSAVIGMIRDNENPLNMTMGEMNDYLDGRDSDPERQAENYARFLLQLEKQDEITELERDSYIGIYRMINSLEKNDDAAVGSVLRMGTEMNFSNMLRAMRSAGKSMDYRIDDDFGGVTGIRKNKAIDDQINAAFTPTGNSTGNTGDYAGSTDEASDGSDGMSQQKYSESDTERDVYRELVSDYSDAAEAPENVIEELIDLGMDVSINNLSALDAIRHRKGDWFGTLAEDDGDELEDAIDTAFDSMEDPESFKNAYMDLLRKADNSALKEIYEKDTYLDVKALQGSMRQISILQKKAENEEYELPVEIDGQSTSIKLQIRHRAGAGELTVTMETENLGKVAADFSMAGSPSGYMVYEKADAGDRLREIAAGMADELGFTPEVIRTEHLELDNFTDNHGDTANVERENADINNAGLYKLAKLFIANIRD